MESVISKILWIDSIIIKEILDIYKLSSENIIYESIGNTFFNEIKSIILKKSVKYEPNEKHLKLVNESFYVILVILIKCMVSKNSIDRAAKKNNNYYSY